MHTIGVAIPIPEPWGGELQSQRKSFGDPLAAAIPTHVTLLPPTEIPAEDVDVVDAHLRAAAASSRPFRMLLRGTGTFRPVSPVVFVQVSAGIGECEQLESAVRSGPLARDLTFAYHPHVTVAHDLPDGVLDRAFEELQEFRASFLVDAFSLYEHGSDGVWRPRRDYLLGDVAVLE